MRVPRPGLLRTITRPPETVKRSCMLNKPNPDSRPGRDGTETSKPMPSSSIRMRTLPAGYDSVTLAAVARACFTTLISVSRTDWKSTIRSASSSAWGRRFARTWTAR